MAQGPAPRGAGDHSGLQPEVVEDLVQEPDRATPKCSAREGFGVAEAETRSVDEVGTNPCQVFQQHQVRQ